MNDSPSSDFRLDEETQHKLTQLACFVRQLNYSHSTDDTDINIDDSLGPSSSPDVSQETGKSADIEAILRQTLVDAIAFIASTEQMARHTVAISAEELDEPKGIRFRVSVSGEIPDSMMSELKELGVLLGQLDAESKCKEENDAQQRVFDTIIQMRRPDLATLLKGGLGSPGLLGMFQDAHRNMTILGNVCYPPYSETLEISPGELKANGAYNADTHEKHMEAAWSYFIELDRLCRKSANRGKKDSRGSLKIGPAKELISLVYQGRNSKCFQYLLTLGDNTAPTRLYTTLRKLGRYWKCSLDLAQCARSVPFADLFQNIEFCAIPRIPTKSSSLSLSTSNGLARFLKSIGYHEDDLVNYCKETNQTASRVKRRFEKLQMEEAHVHPEIGLILFYAAYQELSPAPQIGCSKRVCPLCSIFIKHHPHFQIYNTHSESYVAWGVPDFGMATGNISYLLIMVQQAMQDMGEAVRFRFLDSPQKRITGFPPPESSSNVSEAADDQEENPVAEPEAETTICKLHFENFNPGTSPEAPLSDLSNYLLVSLLQSMGKSTYKDKPFRNKFCDTSPDITHNFDTPSGRPMDSADYLVRYCYEDVFPDAGLVEGFGFERCQSHDDWIYLLGLYIGIVKFHEVSSQTLRKWQQRNSLARDICKTFEDCTTMSRGGYYKWFQNKKHLVDTNAPKLRPEERGLNMDLLRKYLPAKDRKTPLPELKPTSKREVAMFYGSLLGGTIYSNGEVWNRLGFSTCSNNRWTMPGFDELGKFYVELFERCTFEEFQGAYEQRSLEKLARSKGLAQSVSELKMNGIMTGLPRVHPSCYDLKQYVYSGDMTVKPPNSVTADYGLQGCTSAKDRTLWRNTYLKLFDQQAYKDRDLHEACISGKIYDYVKRLLPDTPPEFKRVSSNVYPLQGGPKRIRWDHGEVPKTVYELQGLTIDGNITYTIRS